MMFINVSDSSNRYDPQSVNEVIDTPRSVLNNLHVAYERAQVSLNGTILSASQLDIPFANLGVSGSATLSAIVKSDCAVAFISVSDSSNRYDPQPVDETVDTPRSLFRKLGVNYERAQTSLNGTILSADQLDDTFEQLGVSGSATLSAIVKSDCAAQ